MPMYEFECTDCKATFLVYLTIEERDKEGAVTCEKCGSKNVRQLLSGPTVITSKKS